MAEFKQIKPKINFRDIKSSYIIKRIFSFLNDKQKLNMIVYNKVLQKMLLVNINIYKIISGKYKTGGKKGNGKEYIIDTNILIFEGEYLNGRRNGKGREYYKNGKLIFEGEYLNGKKWNGNGYNINGNIEFEIKDGKGNIKEFDFDDGKLKYEGEYLKGERNGKGKEFYKDGELLFQGEFKNGRRNGKGKKYYECKILFEGEYLNGRKNGKGKEYYRNGKLKFEGEYLNGTKWNGNGFNIDGNIEF